MNVAGTIRKLVDTLDKPWLRYGLIPWVTGLAAVKNRTPLGLIYYREGVWIHRQRGGVIVDRRVNFQTLAGLMRDTRNYWGLVYEPRPGDVVLDVGAGIGTETYYYSKGVGPGGQVVAIEAQPMTFRCLRLFCERNGLSNVIPMNVAAGDREGEILIDDRENHLTNSIVGTTRGIPVRMRSLDDLIDELGLERIDFLKMNIEGAEQLAIMGLSRNLHKVRGLCISCHDFIADAGGPQELRTKAKVRTFLEENHFVIQERPDDTRPWIRDQLNAIRVIC